MDKITTGMLKEFCDNFELSKEPEDDQFEHFAAYLTVRKHYSETSFDPTELVTGSGGDNWAQVHHDRLSSREWMSDEPRLV